MADCQLTAVVGRVHVHHDDPGKRSSGPRKRDVERGSEALDVRSEALDVRSEALDVRSEALNVGVKRDLERGK
jgi:hypothetical protein